MMIKTSKTNYVDLLTKKQDLQKLCEMYCKYPDAFSDFKGTHSKLSTEIDLLESESEY